MTSIPEVPNAPAVILYREQISDDFASTTTYYVRIKILTEAGKEYANIELPATSDGQRTIYEGIAGRTVHPDGSIAAFTGKPYEKLVEKGHDYKLKAKIFTLPDVQVGSILEYRYKRSNASMFYDPVWIVQTDLFARKQHFSWKPDLRYLYDPYAEPDIKSTVAWAPLLPAGAHVLDTKKGQEIYLDIADVPPIPHDPDSPPLDSLSYRVLFYVTSYNTTPAFWMGVGKRWSTSIDKFIGPGPGVTKAVADLAGANENQEAKLRKFYTLVQSFENTDYARRLTAKENKVQGFKDAQSTDDTLLRKRGTSPALTMLFVAMARAAGLKAYVAAVTDRSQRVFLPSYLSFDQLTGYIAIVTVDGKEVFFDPGEPFCEFEHLAWTHTLSGGLRQTSTGADTFSTPGESASSNRRSRVAALKLDPSGDVSGQVILTYMGASALHWRQRALLGDQTSLKTDLRTNLESMLPTGTEVTVGSIDNLQDSQKQLKVTFDIKGPAGAATGKRLLVPADLFESNAKPRFPTVKRDLPVDLRFADLDQDAVSYTLPPGFSIESLPKGANQTYKTSAAFSMSSKQSPAAVTLYRNVMTGKVLFPVTEYPGLRDFYTALQTAESEPLILVRAPTAAPAP